MSAKVPSVLHSLPIRTTSKSEPADCAVAGEARAAPLSYAPTLQTTRVMTQFTRIAILGATGRMGQAVAAAVAASPQLVLGAAVERAGHADIGKPIAGTEVQISADLASVAAQFDVLIDFTRPEGTLAALRSEEHTSELQSLMRISY